MKKHVRTFLIYIIMVCFTVTLSGCGGANSYEGKDLVDKAKTLHTELEAAHITVQDIRGGHHSDRPPVQEIWYRFQGDVMQYMYIGRDLETGEEYYEFNNGTELDTWHTGDAAWTGVAKGSEGYYNYSKAKRHYFADGELLLNDYPSAIKSAREQSEVGETKYVSINYDDAKIAQYEQMTGITDYWQSYWIDQFFHVGRCINHCISYKKDGEKYSFEIGIGALDPDEPIKRVEPPALSGEITETEQ